MESSGPRRTTRLGVTLTAACGALLLGLGPVAWACTATHDGDIWFCPTADYCSISDPQEFSAGGHAYSLGSALVPSRDWNVRWTSKVDNIIHCRNQGTNFVNETDGGEIFRSNYLGGGWKDTESDARENKLVTMPTLPGDYSACAVTVDNGPQEVSNHINFTLT